MSESGGTIDMATTVRELAVDPADDEASDMEAPPATPRRLRWLEFASLCTALALIVMVCRAIQHLLGV